MAETSSEDVVLDVACGPGTVACAFASYVNHVTGIDMTPAMLESAQRLAESRAIGNGSWRQGEGEALPFPDHSFSIVLSRYAFHHCVDPNSVLSEVVRVCRPGGKVLVDDVVLPAAKVDGYNQLERLRDPSHIHALSEEESQGLFLEANFQDVRLAFYKVEIELEQQMAVSFPNPGDGAKIRQIFRDDVGIDRLGVNVELVGSEFRYEVPIRMMAAQKGSCAPPPPCHPPARQSHDHRRPPSARRLATPGGPRGAGRC